MSAGLSHLKNDIFTYLVLVEDSEYQRGKFCGVAVGEKLSVDLNEPSLGEEAIWTVFEKSLVPLFNFFFGNYIHETKESILSALIAL